jgi:hypothetical protein
MLVIRRLFSFTGGERPEARLRPLFNTRAGTRVESPAFRKLAWQIHHILVYYKLFV